MSNFDDRNNGAFDIAPNARGELLNVFGDVVGQKNPNVSIDRRTKIVLETPVPFTTDDYFYLNRGATDLQTGEVYAYQSIHFIAADVAAYLAVSEQALDTLLSKGVPAIPDFPSLLHHRAAREAFTLEAWNCVAIGIPQAFIDSRSQPLENPDPEPIPVAPVFDPDMADFATDEAMGALDIGSGPSPPVEPLPFAKIPQAMRAVKRWCVWRKQADGRKIPYTVLEGGQWSRSKRCKSNDPSMWVSFDEALHCFLKSNGHLGGLSFALDDGWAGVDFDDVIVDGQVHPQVKSWLASLGGYQEVSQSKEGIKTILRGALSDTFLASAETGRMFKGIPAPGMATEVWYARRFFFLTGEGSGEPRENQPGLNVFCDELLARWSVIQERSNPKPKPTAPRYPNSPAPLHSVSLSDDEVLERIRNSRQAVKFESLWNGQIGSYESASEADMALTTILMFWCQNDTAQVERLFERSGLANREKWNRQDYRDRTLAKAECSEVYVPSKADAAMERLRNRSKGSDGEVSRG